MNKEEQYLEKCQKVLNKNIDKNQSELNDLIEKKDDFAKNYADDYYYMDDEEALSGGEFLGDYEGSIYTYKKNIDKLYRQKFSPYFASINFIDDNIKKEDKIYIGIGNILDENTPLPLVCDWRAPVSSIFYDYEVGRAEYEVPSGKITGEITNKKQYKIEDGVLKYTVDSSSAISDEILKKALSENASSKMKTIISTIQKEQNKIIRNEDYKCLLVQGVAGSGKTSIALHRVAYLLYKHKNELSAEDILIISPNTLFSGYIANVLPELGEENIMQTSILTLAETELKGFVNKLETREEMLADILSGNNKRLNENAYKNTFEFYESLKEFLNKYFDVVFEPKDIKFGETKILAEEISKLYNETYKQKTPAVRIDWITDYIMDRLNFDSTETEIAERIKKNLYPFFKSGSVYEIYDEFLKSIGLEFNLINEKLKYEDMPAIWLIKNYLLGTTKEKVVKYLIIDEMQDYCPIIYEILNEKFDCKKTILGDINQCIDKIMTEEDLNKLADLTNAKLLSLNKSYRSTYEITSFAEKIKGISCDKVERHGKEPIEILGNKDKRLASLKELVSGENDYNYTAILCRDEKTAKELYFTLEDVDNINLITAPNQELTKCFIMPIALSKGLEFDRVVIFDYNNFNKNNFIDKNLLYVASTRALHELYLN